MGGKKNIMHRLKKKEESSSSDSSSDSDYDEEEEEEEEETESDGEESEETESDQDESGEESEESDDESEESEDEDFDKKAYKKLIAEMFPSKYSKDRASSSESSSEEKSKKAKKGKFEKDKSKKDKSKKDKSKKDKSKKDKSKKDKSKKSKKSKSSSDSSASSSSAESDDQNINIILSIDDDQEYLDYFGGEEEEDELAEEEDCNTDDEQTFMKETYEKVDAPPDIKTNKKDKKIRKQEKEEKNTPKESNIDVEYRELLELKKDLSKKLENSQQNGKENKILKRAIKECRESIHNLIKEARKKNTKEYKALTQSDQNKPNEFTYFRTKLSNSEQMKVMQDFKEVNLHINIDKPYRLALLESSMPAKCKAIAMQKLNVLKQMDPGEHEYYKIKNWVDAFMKIPFGVHKNLSVKMADGVDACHTFMKDAKQTLDECVYGLDDAKLQIMQMLGQWITNPDAMGTAIAIKGPPGTGKTTLVKDGISKILGREFVFIPLGGTGDASFLEGHSYTYEGSTWGKIVQTLIQCGSMNPVFFFDELDKVSDTPKGEEIIGILTHLTDTTQNAQFHDKYFSEVDFDLSKCLFIFSYNDETKINPILKDRMYRIETKGYDAKEKLIIARNYMLPKIREQVNFAEGDIVLPDDTIKYIISTKHLTQEESGVRNMKRCLEIIHTKLNLFRLVKPEDNLFSKEIAMQVSFPYTVMKNHVDILIKNEEKQSQSLLAMYC